MPKRSCPQCRRRIPFAARRCVDCGWSYGRPVDTTLVRRSLRRRSIPWVLGLLLLLGVGAVATWNAGTVADWYAGFAARHLPAHLSAFAPTDTETGAFFYCARQVAKRMDGDYSVETFPSPDEGQLVELSQGRYRVVAWVEEARESGARVRHGFECTARYQGGRWSLEGLRLERYAADGSPPVFVARVN